MAVPPASQTGFHFMRLPQRILLENRAPTAIDEFYPKRRLDHLLASTSLLDTYVDKGNSLPDALLTALENDLHASREVILYCDLPSRPPRTSTLASTRRLSTGRSRTARRKMSLVL